MNQRFASTILISAALALGAARVTAQSPGSTGQIKGAIHGPDGKALTGAIVSLSTAPRGTGHSSAIAKTTADGNFTLASVSPGSYQVCVQAPRRDLLNPCKWKPTLTTVQAGKTTDVGIIELAAGTLLRVHIIDSGKVLTASQNRKSGSHLLIGVVTGDGLFTPMPVQSANATSRDYELYVPQDQSMQLSVFSKLLKLADQNGKPVDQQKGVALPMQAQGGNAPRVFNFQVTGVVGKP